MLDEARAKKNGALTTAAKGWAVPEAQAARTIERAKALKIAPTAAPAAQRAAKERPNFRTLDRLNRALLARATQGVSPAAVAETWADWALHLAAAPGKRLELLQRAAMTMARFGLCELSLGVPPALKPRPHGRCAGPVRVRQCRRRLVPKRPFRQP